MQWHEWSKLRLAVGLRSRHNAGFRRTLDSALLLTTQRTDDGGERDVGPESLSVLGSVGKQGTCHAIGFTWER